MSEEEQSHLYAVKTSMGQEKKVMNMLQTRLQTSQNNIHAVLLVEELRGYVVMEAPDSNDVFHAVDGVRHVRGQLRGELTFNDIEGYLVKRSAAATLSVNNIVEITGGPFKGMKATITRIDREKEEATVILLDAAYQLPVTVDANYLKKSAEA